MVLLKKPKRKEDINSNDDIATFDDVNLDDFFSFVYESAPVAYFNLDHDGNIHSVNKKGVDILELKYPRIVNKNIREFISPEHLINFNEFLENIENSRTKQTCELSLLKPPKYIRLEGTIYDSNKYIISAIDISNQKQGLDTMKKAEIYRRLFESSKDGIVILNAKKGTIIDVNPSLSEIIEYSKDELVGKKMLEVNAFRNITSLDELIQGSKNDTIGLYQLYNKKGIPKDVEFVCYNYKINQTKEIQCNIRDITERKKNEDELKESENSLKTLNASKDKFFTIISHDLRSPFNCIIGYCELLIEKAKERDFRKIESFAQVIHQASWRAMNLLSDLIDWSRSQSGKIQFNPEDVEIADIVNEVLKYNIDAADKKSITIEKNLPKNMHIFADRLMLNTILRNLIANSVKFTKPGGWILISAVSRQEDVMISVCDNGIGMSQKLANSLFHIESLSSTDGTQDEKGTGLGLLLCKEFVTKHNGQIWVESELGSGSNFHFSIPTIPR